MNAVNSDLFAEEWDEDAFSQQTSLNLYREMILRNVEDHESNNINSHVCAWYTVLIADSEGKLQSILNTVAWESENKRLY